MKTNFLKRQLLHVNYFLTKSLLFQLITKAKLSQMTQWKFEYISAKDLPHSRSLNNFCQGSPCNHLHLTPDHTLEKIGLKLFVLKIVFGHSCPSNRQPQSQPGLAPQLGKNAYRD